MLSFEALLRTVLIADLSSKRAGHSHMKCVNLSVCERDGLCAFSRLSHNICTHFTASSCLKHLDYAHLLLQ